MNPPPSLFATRPTSLGQSYRRQLPHNLFSHGCGGIVCMYEGGNTDPSIFSHGPLNISSSESEIPTQGQQSVHS